MSKSRDMSFLDHLEELRWHIIRSTISILLFATVAFLAKDIIFDQIIFGPKKGDFISQPYKPICDNILSFINKIPNSENINFILLRDFLYDILIYNINVNDCIWYILQNINHNLTNHDISLILLKTYNFLYYYNNNYRPIYHLENFIIFIIKTVHKL